ncbi:MAG TPA: complex I NDUFA9 subunit family protein [Chloroflexota bacterium]|nr:complex I NDUFA9 subunit family protein [Chloroflexota bacterium]
MPLLVTGGTGFVGSHLVRRLARQRSDIRLLVRSEAKAAAVRAMGMEAVVGTVTDVDLLRRACDGVDSVVHLVAVIVERDGATFEAINVAGTANLIRVAESAGVGRFVHLSALGAGEDPRFPYLYSKWRGAEIVRGSRMPYTILEPSILYGEGDDFLNRLAGVARLSPVFLIAGSGATRFQPLWVEDLVTCLERCLDGKRHVGRTIALGGPEYLTYEQMVDLLIRELGLRRWKIHMPLSLMRLAAGVMERTMSNPTVTPSQLDMLEIDNLTALDAVSSTFEFSPARLEEKIAYLNRPQAGSILGG